MAARNWNALRKPRTSARTHAHTAHRNVFNRHSRVLNVSNVPYGTHKHVLMHAIIGYKTTDGRPRTTVTVTIKKNHRGAIHYQNYVQNLKLSRIFSSNSAEKVTLRANAQKQHVGISAQGPKHPGSKLKKKKKNQNSHREKGQREGNTPKEKNSNTQTQADVYNPMSLYYKLFYLRW